MTVPQTVRAAAPWLIVGGISAVMTAGAVIVSPEISEWVVGGVITVWTVLGIIRVVVLAGMARMLQNAMARLPQSRLHPAG